jgi:hypothetical protein
VLDWQQRGAAVVSPVVLTTGCRATVVIAGAASNPKGAAVVMPGEASGEVKTVPLVDTLPLLHPACAIEIYAMQERLYGDSGLPNSPELKSGT